MGCSNLRQGDLLEGYYCIKAQIWVVLPNHERSRSSWNPNVVVGYPGFDGVEFQTAEGSPEVLAYYPNTDEIGVVAADLEDLVKRWNSDSIKYPF